ncbi:MAG: YgiT-type zinc finger protein [Nitrospirae bacterium]|nr:MAG: YgiT-type zinc finger protein [Nitrospirota bacterium]
MKCLQCNGEMEKGTVPYSVDRKGYHLYLRDIPAFVCSQCGEKYFPEDEVDAIQSVIKTLEQQIDKLKAA